MHSNNVKSLVYSSSATVYGTPVYLPLTETHPTGQGCTNPYGKTKYFVEEIGKDLCSAYPVSNFMFPLTENSHCHIGSNTTT